MLLPYNSGKLLCNWSAVGEPVIAALLGALKQHWQARAGAQGNGEKVFCDLGCGDGRVVTAVCSAFPDCRGVGVDLNAVLVEKAQARARRLGIHDRCNFRAGDLAETNLSDASAVFLYLPKPGLQHVATKVLPCSKLPRGAGLFCATDPLVRDDKLFTRVQYRTESVMLFCYIWQGRVKSLTEEEA